MIVASTLCVPACGNDVGMSTGPLYVDRKQLSTEVQAQVTEKLGREAPPVSCPGNLEPDVGATVTCTMSGPDGSRDVTVTVTAVDWTGMGNFGVGNAQFDAKVADKPNP